MAVEPHDSDSLPRELTKGLFWLGACDVRASGGREIHTYNSMFLLCGEERSMLVEGGPPKYMPEIEAQVDTLLVGGDIPPISYVFATHSETPHAGGIGRWLEKFPETTLVGEIRDYHLFWPEFEDRFVPYVAGESLDLGGTSFRFIEPVIYDLPATMWGFDTARRVLFPADGFAYAHDHDAGHCGRFAEETRDLPVEAHTVEFTKRALYWMLFCDTEPYVQDVERLLHELNVEMICPTHGLPIADLETIVPRIAEGIRASSQVTRPLARPPLKPDRGSVK